MVESFLGSLMPVGFTFAPKGWASCEGQIMNIAQNTALFSLLGTAYGGNGSSTFALPDLRGRTLIGAGQGGGLSNYVIGQQGGSTAATLNITNLPAHTHTVNARGNGLSSNSSDPNNNYFGGGTNIFDNAWDNSSVMNAQCITSGIAGGGQSMGIRNPYLGMYYVICTSGIFPSRN